MRFEVDKGFHLELAPHAAIVAGFTGRDRQSVERHVRELADQGVPVPDVIPSFYTVPPHLLVQAQDVTVTHDRTSGEAEVVLLLHDGEVYVTVGSDHTDRLAETKDIALSKIACPKVLANRAWRLSETIDRWDDLRLRSWIARNGRRDLYQEGTLSELLAPKDLLARIPFQPAVDNPDVVIFAGTLAARGGIRAADQFEAELEDPIRDRAIRLSYQIRVVHLLAAEMTQ